MAALLAWGVVSVSLPLNGAAIYATSTRVPKGSAVRVYVLNLLVSDLIQLWSMTGATNFYSLTFNIILLSVYFYTVMVSLGFMACIALERYLVSAWPPTSCCRKAIQITVVVCTVVWVVPLFVLFRVYEWLGLGSDPPIGIFMLLPFPLLLFCLGGTIRAQCAAGSEPPGGKRRMVASVLLLVLVYSLLFLPGIVFQFRGFSVYSNIQVNVLHLIQRFSPLADLLLYFCLEKRASDEPAAASRRRCCFRRRSDDGNGSAANAGGVHVESSV